MRGFSLAVVLLTSACTSAPAPAQPLDAPAMARRFAELHNPPELWRVYAESHINAYIAALPDYFDYCETALDVDGCEKLVREMLPEIESALKSTIYEIERIRPGILEDYAAAALAIYTPEELAAALAFAETSVGRSMIQKSPAMLARSTPTEYARLTPWASSLESVLTTIYEKYTPGFMTTFEGTDERM